MKSHLIRLLPNQDIKQELIEFSRLNSISVGSIISAVGSVSIMNVRIADGKTVVDSNEYREVFALSGTIIQNKIHAHIAAINSSMEVFGGHLMVGCIVHTTMEITLLDLSDDIHAQRIYDENTGYDELFIDKA
jgi:predicted DNA-binding protein with PD1-like motif